MLRFRDYLFNLLLFKPTDIIPTLTYVFMDNFCSSLKHLATLLFMKVTPVIGFDYLCFDDKDNNYNRCRVLQIQGCDVKAFKGHCKVDSTF
jgi:hypothetical protein